MPGDRLPSEATLSRELNVSRTVVREAFRSLAAIRIIEIANGKRATVAELDHGAMGILIEHGVHTDQISVQQIYDVRRTIETRVAALAAIRRSDAEAEEIARLARRMREAAEEPERQMQADLDLHLALARASRNPVFALLIGAFQGITRRTWPIGRRSRSTPESRDAMLRHHEEIAEAVAAGDPERAARAMGRHFDESVRALVAAGVA